VVGMSLKRDGSMVAFLWERGRMRGLRPLGDNNMATSINDAGVVVGVWTDDLGDRHSFIWRRGRTVNLQGLLAPDSGWNFLGAQDIDEQGRIVGDGTINNGFRAFLIE